MAVLVYAENKGGAFKKAAHEATTYGADLAAKLGTECIAVSVGTVADDQLATLGAFGATKVISVSHDKLAHTNDAAYAAAIAQVAAQVGANVIVVSQSTTGRAVAPRVAIKTDSALFSGVTGMLEQAGSGYTAKRIAYTSKVVEMLSTESAKLVVSVRSNSYKVVEKGGTAAVEKGAYTPNEADFKAVLKETKMASGEISLTEADVVVSAGRGLGNEQTFTPNWAHIGELAHLLGAATACSKPIGDLEWRPHHEHVGQTGVQIAPNVYIAVGISGAIQHLAGVSSSKTIIVINKDPEAPFFKAADYGIVGDAVDVVSRLVADVKAYKASH